MTKMYDHCFENGQIGRRNHHGYRQNMARLGELTEEPPAEMGEASGVGTPEQSSEDNSTEGLLGRIVDRRTYNCVCCNLEVILRINSRTPSEIELSKINQKKRTKELKGLNQRSKELTGLERRSKGLPSRRGHSMGSIWRRIRTTPFYNTVCGCLTHDSQPKSKGLFQQVYYYWQLFCIFLVLYIFDLIMFSAVSDL